MFKLDKEVASEIQKQIAAEPLLADLAAGWHVIVGKNFASAITYKTKYVCFFDLFEGCPKSFLFFKTEWADSPYCLSFKFDAFTHQPSGLAWGLALSLTEWRV